MNKSLERLSTGLKINRAQDDAAGLAVSESMRARIRGMGKAMQNSQDGIAALQIAEGAAGQLHDILQRQRELAIQAANDTLTSTERGYLDLEFQALTSEIDRIASSSEYNGMNVLTSNGDADPAKTFGFDGAAQNTLQVGPSSGGSNVITLNYEMLDSTAFQLAGEDITDRDNATKSLGTLDAAIQTVSRVRASIGSYINRLDYTVNNLSNMTVNTQDAESRIRDTDFAHETTQFTKNQLLVQSATSMLAQANTLPQNALTLLQ
jgi:flagellin